MSPNFGEFRVIYFADLGANNGQTKDDRPVLSATSL